MTKIETTDELKEILGNTTITETAFQSMDLTEFTAEMLETNFKKCIFLGCIMSKTVLHYLQEENFIFPRLEVPFNTYPYSLYNKDSLYKDFNYHHPESYLHTFDKIVYDYYKASNKENSIKDTLSFRLHDHSITDSLHEFISKYDERIRVAIMGGHRLKRSDAMYLQIARLSKSLTAQGYLMLSGGGPGAMEATHFGAWMAGREDEELVDAVNILAQAPIYSDERWLATAFEVMEKFPYPEYQSLGIPTWHYGHELPTPFATHIAKYFENSVREEGLLELAKGGVIFTPGSAGTMQEVFQDLAQNHYESYGFASPMVFLDTHFWTASFPVYPMIEKMAQKGDLLNLNLGLYDSNEEIVAHLGRFSGIKL